MTPHGEWTAQIAKTISQKWEMHGYKVFYDHDISSKNVGKIVSTLKKDYVREDELSQLDIAIVDPSDKVAVLVEIEETSDIPKTFLGDIFGILFGEYLFIKRKELHIGDNTTLVVVGVNESIHAGRNKIIQDHVNNVKDHLNTRNAKIKNVEILTFSDESKLIEQLPFVLEKLLTVL